MQPLGWKRLKMPLCVLNLEVLCYLIMNLEPSDA